MLAFKHLVLLVPNLEQAEKHDRATFDAELVGREALAEDAKWGAAPHDLDLVGLGDRRGCMRRCGRVDR